MRDRLNIMMEKIGDYTLNEIYLEDCINAMKKLPEGSADLIIADPPYNLSKGNGLKWDNSVILKGMGGNWNKVMENWDNMSFEDYWHFTHSWLLEAKRILKPSGSIMIYGTYHNIGVINVILQLLNYEIINELIWYKRNSFPNLSGRRFTASHETILWAHNGNGKKRKYKFNYELIKNMEFKEDKLKEKGKQMRTVWDIPNNKEKEELIFGKHPTQKPVRVNERIILSTTHEKDLIVVPFCGAGSECIAALKNNRRFLGFEIDKNYFDIADKRIKHHKNEPKQSKLGGV